LVVYEKVPGKEHPSTATTYNNIALVDGNQGDYEKALELHGKSIRVDHKVFQPNQPRYTRGHASAKATHEKSGMVKSFEDWLAEVFSQEEQ